MEVEPLMDTVPLSAAWLEEGSLLEPLLAEEVEEESPPVEQAVRESTISAAVIAANTFFISFKSPFRFLSLFYSQPV